jgi:hypothetical protein
VLGPIGAMAGIASGVITLATSTHDLIQSHQNGTATTLSNWMYGLNIVSAVFSFFPVAEIASVISPIVSIPSTAIKVANYAVTAASVGTTIADKAVTYAHGDYDEPLQMAGDAIDTAFSWTKDQSLPEQTKKSTSQTRKYTYTNATLQTNKNNINNKQEKTTSESKGPSVKLSELENDKLRRAVNTCLSGPGGIVVNVFTPQTMPLISFKDLII